jgi:hypothetical protein
MKSILISISVGIAAGIIDIIPMIAQKLPLRATISAFLQYFFVSIVIFNIKLPILPWWSQGGIIALCLALPIIVLVSENDKTAPFVISIMAMVLGTLISFASHFWKG